MVPMHVKNLRGETLAKDGQRRKCIMQFLPLQIVQNPGRIGNLRFTGRRARSGASHRSGGRRAEEPRPRVAPLLLSWF